MYGALPEELIVNAFQLVCYFFTFLGVTLTLMTTMRS